MHQMLVVDLLALCFCIFFICMCLCLCVKAGQCYLDLKGKGTSKLGRQAVLLANNKYNQHYSQQTCCRTAWLRSSFAAVGQVCTSSCNLAELPFCSQAYKYANIRLLLHPCGLQLWPCNPALLCLRLTTEVRGQGSMCWPATQQVAPLILL